MPPQTVAFGVAILTILGAGMYVAQNRMEICHQTGSEEHPWEIIKVSGKSWPTHQAHGDKYPVPEGGCEVTDGPPTPPGGEF